MAKGEVGVAISQGQGAEAELGESAKRKHARGEWEAAHAAERK